MKALLEFGPLLLFFIANKYFTTEESSGIVTATGIFMAALVITLPISWKMERKLPVMPLITAAFVLLFGGLTLYFDNEVFIQLKPTAVGIFFSVVLLVGLARGKLLLKSLLGASMKLEDEGWRILTKRWACYFVVLALINEYVRHNFTVDQWVTFKVWGILPLTFVFAMTQMGVMQRFESAEEEERPSA
jgi:intracellular septation protein